LRSLVDPVVGQTVASELNINHYLVRIEEILLVNKIETAYSTEQLEANPALKTKLEITHEEVKIPNLTYLTNLKTDTINPFSDTVTIPPTESILTIAHDTVILPHQLKIDEITSLQEPDDMINPTQLQIKHEVGFFIRFFFLFGYFSNYFCPHHDNPDIVIISGPIEAVSVLSSYAFT
jgi:hypothetical protein